MARKGGSTYLLVALIFFVIAFVFTLVLSILFYTQRTGAQATAEKASKDLNKVISNNELKSPEITTRMNDLKAGSTLVSAMQKEQQDTLTLANNTPQGTFDSLKAEAETVGVHIDKGATLIGEIRRLNAEFTAAQQGYEQAKKELEEARTASKAAEASKSALVGSYEKSVNSLREELTNLTERFRKFENETADQRKTLEEQLAKGRGDNDAVLKAKDKDLAERDKMISELRQRLANIPGVSNSDKPKSPDISTYPKGNIVAVFLQERRVYIDKGRKDKVTPGLTFEVFDRSTGIPQDKKELKNRGKGSIEVVNVSENTSECRITRMDPKVQLVEGDVLANAVYDPNMKFKFVVFGDFDIDDQGQSTSADKRRIEAMVVDFGGTLQPDITPDTDFLVLGLEPKQPRKLAPDDTNPERIKEYQAALKKVQLYEDAIKRARDLSIPILNQNRFLGLTGYYRR